MQNRSIFYWKGVIIPRHLQYLRHDTSYSEAIKKFEQGEYKSVHFKQLVTEEGRTIYRLKVKRKNRSDRLLGWSIEINGEYYFYIFDVVFKHRYDKAKKKNNESGIEEEVDFYFKEKEIETEKKEKLKQENQENQEKVFIKKKYQINHVPLEFINGELLHLNQVQSSILGAATPALILGPAGSGKSILAITEIKKKCQEGFGLPDSPIYYVTQSPKLAREMEEAWKNSSVSKEYKDRIVRFMTYEEILKEANPTYQDHQFKKDKDCIDWIQEKLTNYLTLHKNDLKNNVFYDDNKTLDKLTAEKIYGEFRIISSRDANQSLFKNEDQKQWIQKLYKKYIKYLHKNNFIHAPFKRLPEYLKKLFLIVDEMQDFSFLQLESLCECGKDNLMILGDRRQSLYDCHSKKDFLIIKINKITNILVKPFYLPYAYRCSKAVTKIANKILHLENILIDGVDESDLYTQIKSAPSNMKEGQVKWFMDEDKAIRQTLCEAIEKDNTSVVIITLPEFIDEAEKKFPGALIFTAHQAKGLQFKRIIAYRLFDSQEAYVQAILKEVNIFIEQNKNKKIKTNRTNREPIDSIIDLLLKNVYTIFTRTMNDLYIFQDRTRRNINYICDFISEPSELENILINQDEFSNSYDEQINIIKSLINTDNIHQAKLAFNKLKNNYKLDYLFEDFLENIKNNQNQNNNPNKLDRDQKYVSLLYENLKDTDLLKVLNHKNVVKLLFNTKIAEGVESLFDYCMQDKERQKNLFNCLIYGQTIKNEPVLFNLFKESYTNKNLKIKNSREIILNKIKKEHLYEIINQSCLLCKDKPVDIFLKNSEISFVKDEHLLYEAIEKNYLGIAGYLNKERKLNIIKSNYNSYFHHVKKTPLMLAVEKGYINIVEFLLVTGAHPFFDDPTFCRLLVIAMQNKHDDIVKYFMKQFDYSNLVYQTAKFGHVELVEFLLKNNKTKELEAKILHVAIEANHLSVVEALLKDKRFNVNFADKNNVRPLTRALILKTDEIAKYLLNIDDIDVNYLDHSNGLPLHLAIEYDKKDLFEIILAKTANPNFFMKNSYTCITPLQMAALRGCHEMIQLLLLNDRVDVNLKDPDGSTALHWAIEEEVETKAETVQLLLQKADPNEKDNAGRTILHYAIENNYLDIFEILLKNEKVNFNLQNKLGKIPLNLIVQFERSEMLDLLLNTIDSKIKPAEKTYNPLYQAICEGKVLIFKKLFSNSNSRKIFLTFNPFFANLLESNLEILQYLRSIHSENGLKKSFIKKFNVSLLTLHYLVKKYQIDQLNLDQQNFEIIKQSAKTWTHLHAAIFCGKVEIINFILNLHPSIIHYDQDCHIQYEKLAKIMGNIEVIQIIQDAKRKSHPITQNDQTLFAQTGITQTDTPSSLNTMTIL